MASRNYVLNNAHEMADATSMGGIDPDFDGENFGFGDQNNDFEAENFAEGTAGGGAVDSNLGGTGPIESPDFLSRWRKGVRARSATAPPFHFSPSQTPPPHGHSQTLQSAWQAPYSSDHPDETQGFSNIPAAQQHTFSFAASDLQHVAQSIEGRSHLAMLLATATQNTLAHKKSIDPQPAMMTRAEFMQCLAYFEKHEFSSLYLASKAFFYSSGGFTLWSFFSTTTLQVFLEKCTTQIANLSNDKASRVALQQAVVQLARVLNNDSAKFLALLQEGVHAAPSDHMAAPLLFRALVQEAIWGAHQLGDFETLQSIFHKELIRPDATVDVVAEVICLARILGLTPPLPCAQSSEWWNYLTELETQLARDGLVAEGAPSGEQSRADSGMRFGMQPYADQPSGTGYSYPDTDSPSIAYPMAPFPAQSQPSMDNIYGVPTYICGEYISGEAIGSLANSTSAKTQTRATPSGRKKVAPRRRAKKMARIAPTNNSSSLPAAPGTATALIPAVAQAAAVAAVIKGLETMSDQYKGDLADAVLEYRYPSRNPLTCYKDDAAIAAVESDVVHWANEIQQALCEVLKAPNEELKASVANFESYITSIGDTAALRTEQTAYQILNTTTDFHKFGHNLSPADLGALNAAKAADKGFDNALKIVPRLEQVILALRNKLIAKDCYNFEAKIGKLVYGPTRLSRMKTVSWNCAQGKKSKKNNTERKLKEAMEAAKAGEEAVEEDQ